MALRRRKSFDKSVPSLLTTNISERYCERKYKEYLMDSDEGNYPLLNYPSIHQSGKLTVFAK